jgi:hypothetical protein
MGGRKDVLFFLFKNKKIKIQQGKLKEQKSLFTRQMTFTPNNEIVTPKKKMKMRKIKVMQTLSKGEMIVTMPKICMVFVVGHLVLFYFNDDTDMKIKEVIK